MLEHFYDFERNQQLLQAMHGFIENIIRPTQSSEKWYSTLKVIIHQQAKFEGPLDICLEDDVSIAVFKAVAGREDSGIRITHTKKGKSHYRYVSQTTFHLRFKSNNSSWLGVSWGCIS